MGEGMGEGKPCKWFKKSKSLSFPMIFKNKGVFKIISETKH
jgi:hypothetical protein